MSDELFHLPGAWLEDNLNDAESEEILDFLAWATQNNVLKIDDVNSLRHFNSYMNSYMHLCYKIYKDSQHLQIRDNSVIDSRGNEIDMFTKTIEFVEKSLMVGLSRIKFPDKYVTPTDRVTRMFFQNKIPFGIPTEINSGSIPLKKPLNIPALKDTANNKDKFKDQHGVLKENKKENLIIAPIITLSLKELPRAVELSSNIEPFDNEVFRAVCSLQEMGNKTFTGHDIYRVMTMNSKAMASKNTLALINNSWNRLTNVAMYIDTGNVGDAYNFVRWKSDRRIIEGRSDTVIVQNQHGFFETTVYTVFEEPILKTYASHLGQIGRYPAKWFNTPISKTPEILIIQTAMLDHILAIPAVSNHILYSTLFSRVNINKASSGAERAKKSRLRTQIHRILDYWVKCNVICSWREIKKGASLYCIEINKFDQKKI